MIRRLTPVRLVGFALTVALVGAGCAQKQIRTEAEPTAAAKSAAQSGGIQTPVASAPAGGPAVESAQKRAAEAARTQPAPPPGSAATELVSERPAVARGTGGDTSAGLQRIHFGFDQATITPEARALLSANAEFLKKHRDMKVRIEGYCDERGTAEYNIALGERRAKSAYQFLSDLGVEPQRMKVVSYGKESPLDAGHSEDAWAKNRRAEFVDGR